MIVDTKKVEDHANVRRQVRTKTFKEFANPNEVVDFIGCDAQTLKDTFATYNENANSETEDDFGLTPERAILEEGPYNVSLALSAVHLTKDGVTCNENVQILYAEGTVVDGLYASGEVTWQSGGYSQFVAFGRIAGQQPTDTLSK